MAFFLAVLYGFKLWVDLVSPRELQTIIRCQSASGVCVCVLGVVLVANVHLMSLEIRQFAFQDPSSSCPFNFSDSHVEKEFMNLQFTLLAHGTIASHRFRSIPSSPPLHLAPGSHSWLRKIRPKPIMSLHL